MLIVGNKLISEDLLEKKFVCDLQACKGACCVEGDSGAPLRNEEAGILEEEFETIRPFLPEKGIRAIEEQGHYIIDSDGDLVTPLVEGQHCAYTVFDESGIASCGIEQAHRAGKTGFRKPISCHLYPIRTKKLPEYEALNYHRWEVCKPACACGEKLQVPVYRFLKEALIRSYGEAWYSKLEEMAAAWLRNTGKQH